MKYLLLFCLFVALVGCQYFNYDDRLFNYDYSHAQPDHSNSHAYGRRSLPNAAEGHLPNQEFFPQFVNVPIIAWRMISSLEPNKVFPSDQLHLIKGERTNDQVTRVLITFNKTGIFDHKDVVNKAKLTLSLKPIFTSRLLTVFPLSVTKLNLPRTTWDCEDDIKPSNEINEDHTCGGTVSWDGGFISRRKQIPVLVASGATTVSFEVADILQKGISGFMIQYFVEEGGTGHIEFNTTGSSIPQLTIEVPAMVDNIDTWYIDYDCPPFTKFITLHNFTVKFGGYYCHSRTANPLCFFEDDHGIPYFADTVYNELPWLEPIREECDIIIANYYCTGVPGRETDCPFHPSPNFTRGMEGDEYLFWRELFYGPQGFNIKVKGFSFASVFDRTGAPDMFFLGDPTLVNANGKRVHLGSDMHDTWLPLIACSNKSNDECTCNKYGYIVRGCDVNQFGVCAPPRSLNYFIDCFGKTNPNECSGCMNDFNFSGTGPVWPTASIINDTMALPDPQIIQLRGGCYGLNNFTVAQMEPFGGPFLFTATGCLGARCITLKEKTVFQSDYNVPLGSYIRRGKGLWPALLGRQKDLINSTFCDQPDGVTPQDKVIGDSFRNCIARILALSQQGQVFLLFNHSPFDLPPFPGNNQTLGPPADPAWLNGPEWPTGDVRDFRPRLCHNWALCNPAIKAYEAVQFYYGTIRGHIY